MSSMTQSEIDRRFIEMLPEQDTPARAAWKTFRSGMLITVIYTGISYVLQASINNFIDDNS